MHPLRRLTSYITLSPILLFLFFIQCGSLCAQVSSSQDNKSNGDEGTADKGIKISLQNAAGSVLASGEGSQNVRIEYHAAYSKGDVVNVTTPGKFMMIQVDPSIPETLVFSPTGRFTFPIPFDLERVSGYPSQAFGGTNHEVKARLATATDLSTYHNVALNPLDLRGQSEYFPHATANVVTRDEPQFYERNAIDGNTQNTHHGKWPYESWGTGQRPDPVLKIDFGREVEIDKVRIFIRCDFPHDSYWKCLSMHFSDGSHLDAPLEKKADGQDFTFPKKKVSWLQLDNFKQPITPLGWAALTEIEVYGSDSDKKP